MTLATLTYFFFFFWYVLICIWKQILGQGHMTWPWHDLGDLDLIFFFFWYVLICIWKKFLGQGHMTWPWHDLDLIFFFFDVHQFAYEKKNWVKVTWHDLGDLDLFFLMCINSKVKGQVRSCDHDLYDIGYESPICEWSRARAVQYAVHPSLRLVSDFWLSTSNA